MLLIGAHLTIPKIVQTAGAFNTPSIPGSHKVDSDYFMDIASEARVSQDAIYKSVSDNSYEPPNYGGPDSEHGSGTR
ncbi:MULTISPECIES: hypothetical protein [Nostocales]|nr:hypothetical protein [Tolypothrix bouteillei]KAF3887695.1 hypothetical protein DA73_0400021020 [Tolypothrix bouteillei VB521301]